MESKGIYIASRRRCVFDWRSAGESTDETRICFFCSDILPIFTVFFLFVFVRVDACGIDVIKLAFCIRGFVSHALFLYCCLLPTGVLYPESIRLFLFFLSRPIVFV